MKKFNEWLSLREAEDAGQGYQALMQFWQQNQGQTVQFKDDQGQVHVGKLIDFLDEGMFVVQDEQGQEHDVHPSQLMNAKQAAEMRPTQKSYNPYGGHGLGGHDYYNK